MASTDKKVVDLESLGEDERNVYLSERSKKFQLTIAICVIYGVIALVLLLITLFTSWGRTFLYEEMFAFIITFILGMILVIVYLANEVSNFKPTQGDSSLGYDSEMCPDYWKIQSVDVDQKDDQDDPFFNDKVNKYHFKYKCVMDPAIIDKQKVSQDTPDKMKINKKDELYIQDSANFDEIKEILTQESDQKKFTEYAANMAGYAYDSTKNEVKKNSLLALKNKDDQHFGDNEFPIPCDQVYPVYMSVMDKENKTKNPDDAANKYRCAYAKVCNVPWTEAGCS